MPIREAIDSEIQVVDTGCSPETRAIVDKYADEVFEFTWVNDFAAARNFQLDQANGKMFLFIDDDEFFLDCKYIIEFFKQPDCTSYNIGGYYQRNYLDSKGNEWEDIEVVRMCTVTPETYFIGKVHEYIEPSYGNAMFMSAQAGHFGYVYKTQEDNIKHSMRNIPLLEEMMEEMPDNLRWPYQLAQEYRACQFYDKLYSLCRTIFDKSFEINEEESYRYRGSFATGIVIALYELERYDEVLSFYEEQMEKDEIMPVPKAKLSAYAADLYLKRNMDEECENAANFYFHIMEKYGEDRGEMFIQTGIFTSDVFDALHTNNMYCNLMTCGMRRDDFGPLTHYYRKIKWNTKVVRINRMFVNTLVAKMAEYGYKQEISPVLKKFFIRPGLRDILQNEIDECCKKEDIEKVNNIKAALKGVEHSQEMYLFMDIRILEKNMLDEDIGLNKLVEYAEKYANYTEEWDKLHGQWLEENTNPLILYPEVALGKRLSAFLRKIDSDPKGALVELMQALGARKTMDSYIQQLSRKYGDYQKLLTISNNNPDKFEEMYHLEEALLNQIANLDAAGNTDEAVSTYRQLVEIMQNTFGVETLHI